MSETVELISESNYSRADVFIAESLGVTRSFVKQLVEKGNVFVNNFPIKKCGVSLYVGDAVTVDMPDPVIISAEPEDLPIDIVYEDEQVIVVNKAQGMVTHPATGTPNGTLVNALMFHSDRLSSINGAIRPGIVHRLDKDTSGLIVIAKTDLAHHSLSEQISQKTATRQYIALLDGNIKNDDGVIEQPIGRNPKDRKLMAVVSDGRYAKTLYRVIKRYGVYTLVEYTLKTGRTHQIRVHSKYINHPVVGDSQYGGSNEFGLKGQLLHAFRLSFDHPTTGERLTFEADLPEYFRAVLDKLDKKYLKND